MDDSGELRGFLWYCYGFHDDFIFAENDLVKLEIYLFDSGFTVLHLFYQ